MNRLIRTSVPRGVSNVSCLPALAKGNVRGRRSYVCCRFFRFKKGRSVVAPSN